MAKVGISAAAHGMFWPGPDLLKFARCPDIPTLRVAQLNKFQFSRQNQYYKEAEGPPGAGASWVPVNHRAFQAEII